MKHLFPQSWRQASCTKEIGFSQPFTFVSKTSFAVNKVPLLQSMKNGSKVAFLCGLPEDRAPVGRSPQDFLIGFHRSSQGHGHKGCNRPKTWEAGKPVSCSSGRLGDTLLQGSSLQHHRGKVAPKPQKPSQDPEKKHHPKEAPCKRKWWDHQRDNGRR